MKKAKNNNKKSITHHNVEAKLREMKLRQQNGSNINYVEIGTDIFDFYEDEEPYKEMQKW